MASAPCNANCSGGAGSGGRRGRGPGPWGVVVVRCLDLVGDNTGGGRDDGGEENSKPATESGVVNGLPSHGFGSCWV